MSRSMSRSRAKSRSASFGMGGLALGLLGYAAYYALNTTPTAEPLLEIGQGTKPPAPAPMVKTSAISNVKTSATVQKSNFAALLAPSTRRLLDGDATPARRRGGVVSRRSDSVDRTASVHLTH